MKNWKGQYIGTKMYWKINKKKPQLLGKHRGYKIIASWSYLLKKWNVTIHPDLYLLNAIHEDINIAKKMAIANFDSHSTITINKTRDSTVKVTVTKTTKIISPELKNGIIINPTLYAFYLISLMTTLFYIGGSLSDNNFNPTKWTAYTRNTMSLIWIIMSVFIILISPTLISNGQKRKNSSIRKNG